MNARQLKKAQDRGNRIIAAKRSYGSLERVVIPPMALDVTDWTTSCDFCQHQEGRHYCLLHSWTVKNMDMLRCKDWCGKVAV